MHLYSLKNLQNEIQAYRQGKFVYIGIPKNALVSHVNIFRDAGWEGITWSDLFEEAPAEEWSFFSHIQNPHTRHTKGVAEYMFRLWDWREKVNDNRQHPDIIDEYLYEWMSDERNGEAVSLMVQSVFDQHTIPITTLLRDAGIDPWKVHWIPMDHPTYNTESLTNNYLSSKKIPLRVSIDQRRHVASDARRKCYEIINNMKQYSLVQSPTPFGQGLHYERHFVTAVMREDINLYVQAMSNYDVDVYQFEDPEKEIKQAALSKRICEAFVFKSLGIPPEEQQKQHEEKEMQMQSELEELESEQPTNNTSVL